MENNSVPISRISFGTTDGKNEARNPNFESLFYTGGGFYNKLHNDSLKYLIIGRKGTGKTVLLRYFSSQLVKSKSNITKFIVAGDFTSEKLNDFDYMEVKEEEREIFWRYLILKELAALVLENESGFLNKKNLTRLREVSQGFDFNIQELINENNSKAGFKIGTNTLNGELSENTKDTARYTPARYFKKVSELTKSLMDVIKKAKNNYYLFFDDLDEIKINTLQREKGENGASILAKALNDFVNALIYVNDMLKDINSSSRIITTFRKDVIDQMQFYGNNLNKYVSDNGITLGWYSPLITTHPQRSELGKLVLHKVRASVPEYNGIEDEELFNLIFEKNSKKMHPFKFIVERGFGRPRDVIKYLDIVSDTFPDYKKITHRMVNEVQAEYSSWFYSEISNEINILENSDSVNKTIELIKRFGRIVFSYEEIKKYLSENKNEFQEIVELKQDLKDLFILGVIGNREKKLNVKRPILEYSYRDGINNPSFTKDFVVHQAVRNYLSL